jgi:enoyl-[acyl-carrier-protein] reductase (NADH)
MSVAVGKSCATHTTNNKTKWALILGVANHRSLAWSCVESFLSRPDWNVIMTYHPDHEQRVQSLLVRQKQKEQLQQQQPASMQSSFQTSSSSSLLQTTPSSTSSSSQQQQQQQASRLYGLPCNVETDIPQLCHERIPELLHSILSQQETTLSSSSSSSSSSTVPSSSTSFHITAMVHAVAFGNLKGKSLLQTSRQDFLQAQDISAFSLLELTQAALQSGILSPQSQSKSPPLQDDDDDYFNADNNNVARSITTLSYLGAHRAMAGYHVMGPAKASLEAVVRGLALELGSNNNRSNNNGTGTDIGHAGICVNAVSAGPIATLSSKGGIDNFSAMKDHATRRAPMGAVSATQVASMVTYLANQPTTTILGGSIGGGGGGGITGQTIYVDGGYSSVDGPV